MEQFAELRCLVYVTGAPFPLPSYTRQTCNNRLLFFFRALLLPRNAQQRLLCACLLVFTIQEETDYLLDMCENLDLRFILIADRWDFPGPKRTVEDLKEHYYAIAYELAVARAGDKALANNNLIVRQPFDAQKERERKEFLHLSLNRSQQQVCLLLCGSECGFSDATGTVSAACVSVPEGW